MPESIELPMYHVTAQLFKPAAWPREWEPADSFSFHVIANNMEEILWFLGDKLEPYLQGDKKLGKWEINLVDQRSAIDIRGIPVRWK